MKLIFKKSFLFISGFAVLSMIALTSQALAYSQDRCPLEGGKVLVYLNYKDKQPTLIPTDDADLNPNGGSATKGVTITHSSLNFDTTVQITKSQNGRYCGVPHKVMINFLFDKINVKYQKKYPLGSCQHNVIITHEYKHVNIYKTNGLIYSRKIKNAVEHEARNLPPEFGYSPTDVRDRISRKLVRSASIPYNTMKSRNKRQNHALDTVKNYMRETRKCLTW